jgi:DNA-binding GntR family transcriptional regulator
MPKPPLVFKRTSNHLLTYVADHVRIGEVLPSENALAIACGVSRTAVHRALLYLQAQRVISGMQERCLLRKPLTSDYFDLEELQSGSERVQQVLMERVFHKDMPPGAEFSETELAREAGASTVSVREFLIGFSRSGLIEKKPRGGWRLCAFDLAFAKELADMREMFEVAAITHFQTLAHDDPAYGQLHRLIARHEQLQPRMKTRYGEFPALDREFHTFLIGLLQNRFAQSFYDLVSFVFHYHYQWDKGDEMSRNTYALQEHLDILHALAAHDRKALTTIRRHLASSRTTLMDAINLREQKNSAQHEKAA